MLRMCSLHALILTVVKDNCNSDPRTFQARKEAANTFDSTSVLTEGVVDDLKQSEIARRRAVHPQLHHHCLRKRKKQREKGSKIV